MTTSDYENVLELDGLKEDIMSSDNKKDIIAIINKENTKSKVPDFKAGDTIKVHSKIVEGNKERIQMYQGVVVACKHGKGSQGTFTVRKISYNVGVERTFLLHSPRIEKIEIVNKGIVRRSKLYYLRDRSGKSARIKTKFFQAEKEAAPAVEAPVEVETKTEDSSQAAAQA